jgi:hypothetical protein
LLTVLGDPARREQLTQAALAKRETWYWDRLAPGFARIYGK